MFIYKITNLITKKYYIGQTIHTLKKRYREHFSKNSGCTKLANSINKHGMDAFTIEMIKKCSSREELNYWEIFYINHYNSLHPFGYNLLPGGNNRRHHPETIEKIRIANLGRKHTEESKIKISKSLKGKKKTKEHIEKVRQGNLNKVISKKTKEKISKSKKEFYKNHPEIIEKIRNTVLMNGSTITQKGREKISKKNSKFIKGFNPKTTETIYATSMISLQEKGYRSEYLSKCCNNKKKNYKGFIWSFITKEEYLNNFKELI